MHQGLLGPFPREGGEGALSRADAHVHDRGRNGDDAARFAARHGVRTAGLDQLARGWPRLRAAAASAAAAGESTDPALSWRCLPTPSIITASLYIYILSCFFSGVFFDKARKWPEPVFFFFPSGVTWKKYVVFVFCFRFLFLFFVCVIRCTKIVYGNFWWDNCFLQVNGRPYSAGHHHHHHHQRQHHDEARVNCCGLNCTVARMG